MATLMTVVDVEAALCTEASWVRDDHTARSGATAPGSTHHAVVVSDVRAMDTLHANGATTASHDHIAVHVAVRATTATSSKISIWPAIQAAIELVVDVFEVVKVLELCSTKLQSIESALLITV